MPDKRDNDENNRRRYATLARSYADGVTELFAATDTITGERGEGGAASTTYLVKHAEIVSPISAELTVAAADLLQDPDPQVRVQAATRLLAKSIADLQVSAYLFWADQDRKSVV